MAKSKEYEEFGEACFQGDLMRIKQFLNAGLSPDGHEDQSDSQRPLSLALMNKQFEAAQMLLDALAKPRYGAAFLDDFLEDSRYEPFIERIRDDACPEIADALQKALAKAAELGNRAVAEKLLTACPSPQEFTPRCSPLIAAVKNKRTEMAMWLIEKGFDHFSQTNDRIPLVTLAILADEPEVLKALFERGESPQRQVGGHQTTLMPGPPLYKRLRHVRDFPKNKKWEVFHEGGLLHVAAVAGSVACAKVLLDAGVDPNAVDSEGRTPAMLAFLGGEYTREVLKLLPEPELSSGPALVDLLKRSLLNDDVEGVKKALKLGADPSQRIQSKYSTESTPLIIAACQGNIDVIQAILASGAEIEQIDWVEGQKENLAGLKMLLENAGLDSLITMPLTSARTAFGWAVLYGQADAMKFLIDAGANQKATDVFGFTALHLASIGDHPHMVRYLVGLGLDLHAQALDKRTPPRSRDMTEYDRAAPYFRRRGNRKRRTKVSHYSRSDVAFRRNNFFRCAAQQEDVAGHAPGVDGITWRDLSPVEIGEIGEQAVQSILNGDFKASPTRPVQVPKGAGWRTIQVPTIVDRTVARMGLDATGPVLEEQFLACSYGFRPGISRSDLLADLIAQIQNHGKTVISTSDIRQAFDLVYVTSALTAYRRLLQGQLAQADDVANSSPWSPN